jgi:hypothetical protein
MSSFGVAWNTQQKMVTDEYAQRGFACSGSADASSDVAVDPTTHWYADGGDE